MLKANELLLARSTLSARKITTVHLGQQINVTMVPNSKPERPTAREYAV
jgi:hypothetical protein